MLESDLERLTARVDALEREVARLRCGIASPAPAATTAARVAVPRAATVVPQPAPPGAARSSKVDLETLIGGRGLLYVGAFLVVVGMSYFLKIAFDRGWIGPPMRVALGGVFGVALIVAGTARRKHLNPYFADTLIALGATFEYLSLFAAGSLFALLPLPAAAAGMFVVTGALCVLAYLGDRQPLALLGIVGGLLSPLLLGSSAPNVPLLFTYLAVLSAGSIALDELRGWRALPIVSLVGSTIYGLSFCLDGTIAHYSVGERVSTALILYVTFASTTAIAWWRNKAVDGWRTTVTSLNAAWFFLGIEVLAKGEPVVLASVFLGLAAAHLIAGRLFAQRAQYWLATIALAFAIPAACNAFATLAPAEAILTVMHLAWIVEATLVGLIAARTGDRVQLALGATIFAAVIVHTLIGVILSSDTPRLLFNARFASFFFAALGIAIVRRQLVRNEMFASHASAWSKIAIDVIALLAISPEAVRLGKQLQPHNAYEGGMIALSIAWALYGAGLIVFGIRTRDAVSRWAGLVLLAVTVLKVFGIDLTDVDLVLRVISAVGLGILMLALAYLYQSRLHAPKSEPPRTG